MILFSWKSKTTGSSKHIYKIVLYTNFTIKMVQVQYGMITRVHFYKHDVFMWLAFDQF